MRTLTPTPTSPPIDPLLLARFAQLATALTGMEFPDTRLHDVARTVRQMRVQTGAQDDATLYSLLAAASPEDALQHHFISHLTIGETHFFRNQPQFEALAETILPEIVARHRLDRRLRIWCAGCATGEEPYSVAILLDRLLPDYATWNVSILATDIDRQALARAQRGVYGAWSFRQVSDAIRTHYFAPEGAFAVLAPSIRSRVTFAHLNLVEAAHPLWASLVAEADLILCRNVLIYFSPATTRAVVDRLYSALSDGGWLLVGHAEPSQELFARYAPINLPGAVAYRRLPAPLPLPDAPLPDRPPAGAPLAWTPVQIAAPPPTLGAVAPEPSAATAPPTAETAAPELAALLAQAAGPQGDGAAAYQLAKYHAERRQWREAEQWVGQALERRPMLAEAHYLHALLLLEAGQPEVALTAARRCIYAAPGYVAGRLLLALLYRRSGEGRRAASELKCARDLLQRRPPGDIVPDTDGARAGQLLASVCAQLAQLE
jgi:chemotaxis protein methyltransferase CheR